MTTRDHLCHALRAIRPADLDGLCRLGFQALDHDLEDEVARLAEIALTGPGSRDSRIWQLLGLARRQVLDCAEAHAAFTRAAALAPRDALIAHSQARTALESGLPSTALFARARALAPNDAGVILGQAAGQMADGDPRRALETLAAVLAANPGWAEGHRAFARISRMHFPQEDFIASLRSACRDYPSDPGPAQLAVQLLIEAQDYAGAIVLAEEAQAALGANPELAGLTAVALSEAGDPLRALGILQSLPEPGRAAAAIHPVRALIRLGRFDEAARLAERRFAGPDDRNLWPYRALLWRILGDARWEWLEGDSRFIKGFDLGIDEAGIEALGAVLRGLHGRSAQPLGQSVRRGSQTDGNIFTRSEPELRRLRAAVLEAFTAYAAQLPPFDPDHPTLCVPREPLRFAGAWSIRLFGQGHHVDHIHMEGWLSAACHIAVPEGVATSTTQEGWLTFGENRQLLPDHEGFRCERPVVGRLVIFPSLMWHGTREIASGERMSVAMDMAIPKPGT